MMYPGKMLGQLASYETGDKHGDEDKMYNVAVEDCGTQCIDVKVKNTNKNGSTHGTESITKMPYCYQKSYSFLSDHHNQTQI